jgi:uncharacterized protein (TIGR03435 family)
MKFFLPLILSLSALAQAPLAFEAATVKANRSGRTDTHSDSDNNRISIVNMQLRRLIAKAYDVRPDQIDGPEFLDTERFDVVAKSETVPNTSQFLEMMQALLADRFKLTLHRESREGRAYALVVAKGGIKIKPVEPDGNSSTNNRRGELEAKGVSMARFAETLSRLGLTVVDQTGVEGVFDFKLSYDPSSTRPTTDASDATGDAGPSIFTALQEQLGLKLESRKVPIEYLVIDHIERVPAEN